MLYEWIALGKCLIALFIACYSSAMSLTSLGMKLSQEFQAIESKLRESTMIINRLAPAIGPAIGPIIHSKAPAIAPAIAPAVAPAISPAIAPAISPAVAPGNNNGGGGGITYPPILGPPRYPKRLNNPN